MRFANGEYAFLLFLLPLLALMLWAARRRTVSRLSKLADSNLIDSLTRRNSDRKSILRSALQLLAILLLILSLTGPQVGGRSTLIKREGIDLLVVLDVSKSMLVQDIRPNRLKRAKLELQALIEGLKGDRIGIISFAGAAFVQCPLTSDYSSARMFLKSLSPNDMPVKGTAIGAALKLAHQLLTDDSGNSASRLIVLLSDGEDHGEELEQSIASLAKDNIPVFAVGIGSASGEPIPQYGDNGSMSGYLKDKGGSTVMSRLNESSLHAIASKTEGEYISLQSGGSLDELKNYVGKMQKQQFESSLYTQYDEKYSLLLWPAFIFLLFASIIDERKKSRWFGFLR